jgi:sigma-B regulation protein RsbU (phosphoserine phosphatase)
MIEPGDFILFYTYGITEAFNRGEEQFGEERLKEILLANRSATADELAHLIEDKVDDFTQGLEASDDITLLVARRLT